MTETKKSEFSIPAMFSQLQSLVFLIVFFAGFTFTIFARIFIFDADANDKCIGVPKTTVSSHHEAKQLALDPQIKEDECGLAFAVMTSQVSTPQVATTDLMGLETGNQPRSRSLAASPIVLHSRPSADRKIFLDFDGFTFPSSTPWLSYFGASPGTILKGFSLDGDYSTFSSAENAYIQEVWRAVSEDFAALNVDVTTEDPGVSGLTRSSISDNFFGSHAVISNDNDFQRRCGCGGVAYVGVVDYIQGQHFSTSYNPYSPNFNFLSFSPGSNVNAADASGIISHETGHNLGMAHDGTTTSSYYGGHSNGLWGTIMGTTYSRAISQWSRKEYRNARVTDTFTNIGNEWINNPDCMARPSCLDTFNVFAGNSMPLIDDDYGQTAVTAQEISSETFSFDGYIGSGGDEDWFKIVTDLNGKLTVTAETIEDYANLDVHLSILDSRGNQMTYNDPVASRGSNGRPLGLNASISNYTLSAGTYFIRVRGTGALNPLDTGYSNYGSVGKYQLQGTLTNYSSPPSAAGTLTVLGTASVGSVLTMDNQLTWSGSPIPEVTTQWHRCDTRVSRLSTTIPAICAQISGETSDTYTLTSDDLGKFISVVHSATSSAGTALRLSASTATAIGQAPSNDAVPTIGGSAAVNQTLTATNGSWTGLPTPRYTYQWFACTDDSSTETCEAISRATSATLRLTSTQSGSYIRVRVTATNIIAATSTFSLATTAVGSSPSAAGTLTVLGTASVGSVLTMDNQLTWSGSPIPEVTTQWHRCDTRVSRLSTTIPAICAQISGETSDTYTLTSDDLGKFISVVHSATSSAGTALRLSASTATAIGQAPSNDAVPTIGGSAAVNQTLTATNGSWTGLPTPRYTYQWFACTDDSSTETCEAISRATSATLRLTSTQSGSYIRVRVTATNIIAATSTFSLATTAVGSSPSAAGTLTVLGTASVGSVLTMDNQLTWSGSPIPEVTTQWHRCDTRVSRLSTTIPAICAQISGETSDTYTLTSDDLGKFISVVHSATSSAGTALRLSASTATAIGQAPSNDAVPTIGGSAAVNQTLTATNGSWTGLPTPRYTYQWFACTDDSSTETCEAISRATSATLRLTSTQSGSYIRVRVTATNIIAATSTFSLATTAVGSSPSAAGTLTVLGTASVGSVLTMDNQLTWSGSPIPEVTTQWHRCDTRVSRLSTTIPAICAQISGETSDTYTLTSDDLGKFISVVHSATSSAGTALRLSASTATAIGQAPSNDAVPTIGGSAAVNQTLTATNGSWTGLPTPRYTYQWFACTDDSSTETCEAISRATSATLRLTSTQSGSYIRVRVTATNIIAATSTFSLATTAVGSSPSAAGTLTVLGTASVGSVLTMDNQLTWSGSPIPEVTTQWHRCDTRVSRLSTTIPAICAQISGETSDTYTLTSDDLGKFISVVHSATSSAGTALRLSASTATAIGQAPSNDAVPTIGGSAAVNQTLTATNGSWTGLPTPRYTYQWFACTDDSSTETCEAISRATSATLRLTSTQSGSYIRVRVTATNIIAATSTFSLATTAVGSSPSAAGTLTVLGTASVGSVLTMDNQLTWSGSPIPEVTTQWHRCDTRVSRLSTTIPAICAQISGETSDTYTLTSDDLGKFISVVHSATSSAGTALRLSASTATAIGQAPSNDAVPTIGGSAVVNQTLTATNGSWTGLPTPRYTYQWFACTDDSSTETCEAISRATSATLRLTSTQSGSYIRVRVTATNIIAATSTFSLATTAVRN